jgi:hypothetical protein
MSEEDQKYLERHPDITGMNSGTVDKDEMEMMDDIGMDGDSGDEIKDSKPSKKSKTQSKESKKAKKSSDSDETDSLEKEFGDDASSESKSEAK